MGAEQKRALWGMMRRGRIVVPTWRGWLLLCAIISLCAWGGGLAIYPFLAVNAPCPGGVLVVDSRANDSCLKEVIAEFHRHHYDQVYVVGGQVDKGAALLECKTFPELTALRLFKLGMRSNDVVMVRLKRERQDRTYAEAMALSQWWRDHQGGPSRVNLLSIGPHARRARLLFEKALAGGTRVGVLTLPPPDFDPSHWWRSSAGFRTVTAEAIGYFYARVFFHKAKDDGMLYYGD